MRIGVSKWMCLGVCGGLLISAGAWAEDGVGSSTRDQARPSRATKAPKLAVRLISEEALSGYELLMIDDNGVPLYVAPRSVFTAADIRAIEQSDTDSSALVIILRDGVNPLPLLNPPTRVAVYMDGRHSALADLDYYDSSTPATLSGLLPGQIQRLMRALNIGAFGTMTGTNLSAAPRDATVAAGGSIKVDIFGAGMLDLRAYQVALDAVGGTGALRVESMFVDTTRADYAFAGRQVVTAADENRVRLLSALYEGSVDALDDMYLGTVVFTAPVGFTGEVEIKVRAGNDTLLRNEAGDPVRYGVADPIVVNVVRPGQGG